MKKLLAFLFWIAVPFYGSAQVTGRVNVFEIDTLYSLRQDHGFIPTEGFHFPDCETSESVLPTGYSLPLKSTPAGNAWTKSWKDPLEISLYSMLYVRPYFRQASALTVRVKIKDLGWHEHTFKDLPEGYGEPFYINLYPFLEKNRIEGDSVERLYGLEELVFVLTPRDASGNPEVTIGEILVMQTRSKQEKELNHPFFCQLEKRAYRPRKSSLDPGMYGSLLSTFSEYCWEENSHSLITLYNGEHKDTDQAIREFFRLTLEKYAYYEERVLDRDSVFQVYTRIEQDDSLRGEALWNEIRSLVASFRDPHFKLESYAKPAAAPAPRQGQGPVRLQEFFTDYYVASVFDPDLTGCLEPGMRVLAIDHEKIDSLLAAGKTTAQVNRMMLRSRSDSVLLTVDRIRDTVTVPVYYNKRTVIPRNYQPRHGNFELHGEGKIAFLKINQWDRPLNAHIFTHIEALKNAQSLILDLRNNPGGDGIATMRLASMLIRQPRIFKTVSYDWNDNTTIKETQVIRPHPLFDLSHLNVVVLVNRGTACASEHLVDFLRVNRPEQTTVIGTERTMGTLAFVYYVLFEDGNRCRINCLGKFEPLSNRFREGAGLEPDIWVTPMRVQDLAPYDDKVKWTAIQLLNN